LLFNIKWLIFQLYIHTRHTIILLVKKLAQEYASGHSRSYLFLYPWLHREVKNKNPFPCHIMSINFSLCG
jgi:hypothetical protein